MHEQSIESSTSEEYWNWEQHSRETNRNRSAILGEHSCEKYYYLKKIRAISNI